MSRFTSSALVLATVLFALSCTAPQNTQRTSVSNTAHEHAPSPEVLFWCNQHSYDLYTRCRNYAQKVRSNPKLEWELFRQFDAPVSGKKAAVEANVYSATPLLRGNGLMIAVEQQIAPQFPPMGVRGLNLARNACWAAVNNFEHGVTMPRETILRQCYSDARGPK